MDRGSALPMSSQANSDDYGSDITIDSIVFARTLANTDAGITSAQTSFMQSTIPGPPSDYGSDLDSDEEAKLSVLIARIEGSGGPSGVEVKQSEIAEEEDNGTSRILRIPKFLSSQDIGHTSTYYSAVESWSQASRRTSTCVQPTQTQPTASHYDCELIDEILKAYLTDGSA
jgi:hypothetical protein